MVRLPLPMGAVGPGKFLDFGGARVFPWAIDGFRAPRVRVKREHGAAYPTGTKTVAAPATVSGERSVTSH